ncbi:uncharacterized protein magl isoform X4 [Neoarius graeffei]|uniref:uncharacterized protein magl isoform X4 n=1 Tax=Neoarius graeffei TaxID=443677 RepID=UPI00298D03F6|nr:uncharacterized protein magl isoform X4 [Neoarius graeffei]
MEDDGTELTLEKNILKEKSCLVPSSHSVFVDLKPGKIDECGNNQADQQARLSPITLTKSSTQKSHPISDIKVTLENESVWSRFHSLGTEMILTKQGRRMFPCCRFKLSGLELQKKYFLVMDIMPLDDFTHKWNGKTWEPVAVDEPHVLGQMCVHPESPALGQQWMDSLVSFYKVKLTNDSTDQEGCVLLHSMHRYQPRLHVVPVDPDSEGTIALDNPNVKTFSFPQTEFYAVTSYQNPQITQLKIDCNPFAMAFREDARSIHLLQDKLRLCSSVGKRFKSPLLRLARNLGEKWKEGAEKSTSSTCIQDDRIRSLHPESASLKEGEGISTKMGNATLNCQNNVALCQENKGNETVVNKCPAEPALDKHVATLAFESSITLEEPLQNTDEPVPLISGTENPKPPDVSEDAVNSQVSCTNSESPTKSSVAAQTREERKSAAVFLPRPPFLNGSQVREQNSGHLFSRRPYRRSRKAKSKWWSNVKYAKHPLAAVEPLNVPLQPDLEDVEGMLFVSFVAKEALNIPVDNIKVSETSLPPPPPPLDRPDHHEAEDVSLSMEERIARLEKILLLHLKEQKHRQVIHPRLQDVGMKLSLLDPKLPIDLQYLGVHLPLLSPIHKGLDKMNPMSLSSSSSPECFVSRTGKTNDPTKIKGWRDKFKTNTVQSAPEGLKNSSAFCSEMLDAYLENEAQQISDRVAVFSKCSASPVSYQLPSKSSSYVVTLDSLLKTRSVSSNKVDSKPMDKTLCKSSRRRSPSAAVPLSSARFRNGLQGTQENKRKVARSFKARRRAVPTVQASRSTSFVSRPVTKKQPAKSQPRWNSSAETRSHVRSVIPVKVQNHMMLQEMEEEAVFHGKACTHITTARAKFALTSLLNFQKPRKRPRFCMPHKDENACPEAFCRLGCICDSLDREIRGPTHCRRVECMFDCNCFKHKVLLLHPPSEAKVTVQQGRKRSLLAFPIADPEREPRPPPASSVPTLWKRTTGEHDPEPLFIPAPSSSFKPVSRVHPSLNVSTSKVQEEDKDPVYLYFESMMTCARVREYNSNPPPQIHMFLNRNEIKDLEQANETVEAGEPASSKNKPETPVTPGEPKPTKLLEILSECNWEPHRNLLLRVLFQRMNSNLLSESFCFGMYKIQLLSTTIKGVDRYATVTYKVCISRADEKEMTEDLQLPEKKTMRKSLQGFEAKVLKTNETRAQKATADTDSGRKSSASVKKQERASLFKRLLSAVPFSTHVAPLGYLKANKKKPGSPAQGLITIRGGTYNQAKLLLGQLGALHPVNRFAAFIVGRLLPRPQDQPKIESDITKACPPKAPHKASSITEVAHVSNQTPSNLVVTRSPFAIAPKPTTASKNRRSNISHVNACSNLLGSPSGTTPTVPGGSRFIVMPGRPSNFAAALSAETVTSSTLPPGQKVVLHPAPGMPESNFLCRYNGQTIQLMPVSSGPLDQPQPSSVSEGSTSQVMQTTYNTCLPKDTRSLQKSLNSTPLTNVLPKPFPVIAPKVLSLSAKSGMNIANGMPAFNLSLNFPGKPGTFSFRIRPPTVEGKSVGSKQSGKLPEPSVNSSSTLVLPGGFTLTKLLHPVVPTVPANVTSAAAHPAGISQNNESTKTFILQGCSPSLEQNCQVSRSIPKPILPETSNCNSVERATAALSHSSDGFPSEPAESVNTATPGKYDWLPEDAEMPHTSDVSDVEPKDMDDWPPSGAERILWMDSADEEENEDSNKELNKNLDVAAGSQAAEEASESKTTTTGTVKADFRSGDECLHGDKLYFNEKLTPKPTHIHENVQHDACSKRSRADEQKHPKPGMPDSDQEKVCDPLLNAANSNTADICKKEPSFSALIKNGANNKRSQISVGSPNIRGQVTIQENCPSVLHKNEPDDKPRKTDVAGDEPDIKNQGLVLFENNSTLCSSKIETYNSQTGENTLLDHFLNKKQRPGSNNNNDGVSIKIESCSNSPKIDTCSVQDVAAKQHIGSQNILPLINKEVTQTVTEFSSDLSKRGLDSNSSQILSHKECYNNPAKHDTVALLHHDDSHENIAISGHAPCSLLDGQTPVLNSTSTAQLLNPASLGQKTGLKSISPLPHNTRKSSPDKPLKSKTAVGEPCGDDEIVVDVVNLTEDEDPSDEFDRGEDNSSDDGEDSDEEDSSNGSTSDSDRADTSDDDDIDVESFEDNGGKRIVNMIKDRTRLKKSAKRAAAWSKKIKRLTNIISPAGYPPTYELVKRQSHTEKERVRRVEMRQSFALLREALNVDEQIRLGRHDILNQARIMILALKDRSQRLEERKKALLQRRSAYLSKIVKLSERTDARDEASFKENHEQQKQFGSQNTVTSVAAPPVNPRRLDSDGNRLPPRLGRWKAPNYIRKRSKKALHQASITTTEKRSLPKIVLQSFSKTESVKLARDARPSQQSSTEVSNAEPLSDGAVLELQDDDKGLEKCDATKVSDGTEKTLVSEHANTDDPTPSSALTESDVQNNTMSKLEKDEQASAAAVKVRKKRGRSEVVIEEALSSPDFFGPRQLRQRATAVNGRAAKGGSANKRRRMI